MLCDTSIAEFVADTTFVNGDQSEPRMTVLADGRILVVWTDGARRPARRT